MNRAKVANFVLYPGIMLHEISHAFVARILPGIKVTEIDFSNRQVQHEGVHTATREFLIGHAPVFVHTAIIIFCVNFILNANQYSTIIASIIYAISVYTIITVGFSALPSLVDAKSPFIALRDQIRSPRVIIVIFYGPIVAIASIPGLIVGYIGDIHIHIYWFVSGVYTILLILFLFGVF